MHRNLHKLGVEIVTYHMPTEIEEGGLDLGARLRRGAPEPSGAPTRSSS